MFLTPCWFLSWERPKYSFLPLPRHPLKQGSFTWKIISKFLKVSAESRQRYRVQCRAWDPSYQIKLAFQFKSQQPDKKGQHDYSTFLVFFCKLKQILIVNWMNDNKWRAKAVQIWKIYMFWKSIQVTFSLDPLFVSNLILESS